MLRVPLLCAVAAAVIAADGAAADGEPWRGAVTPYLLLANITGDVADGEPATLPVEVDTGTVLEHLDLGFMVRGEIGRGAWTLLGDLAYLKLSDDKALTNGTEIDAELTQLMAEIDVGYRVPVGGGWIESLAGVRYWDLDIDLGANGGMSNGRSVDVTWADPVIGARGAVPFAESWHFLGRADLGGFGVGSRFTWQLEAGAGWQALPWLAVVGSYRLLSVDYDEDREAAGIAYDVIIHGPQFGATFSF